MFKNLLDRRNYEISILATFLFSPFYISLISLTFSSKFKNLLLVNVAMLSLYQSPVKSSNRKVQENVSHKVNYRYYYHFQDWKLYRYLKELEGLPSQGQGKGWILRITYFLENYSGTDDWQCRFVICRSSYVCHITHGRKTHDLWKITWYIWMNDVIPEASH